MRDDLRAAVAKAFLRNDLDVDGRIDRYEFQAVIDELSPESEGLEQQAFEAIDTNDDGMITFDEFVGWWLEFLQDEAPPG